MALRCCLSLLQDGFAFSPVAIEICCSPTFIPVVLFHTVVPILHPFSSPQWKLSDKVVPVTVTLKQSLVHSLPGKVFLLFVAKISLIAKCFHIITSWQCWAQRLTCRKEKSSCNCIFTWRPDGLIDILTEAIANWQMYRTSGQPVLTAQECGSLLPGNTVWF